jgi:hypothetical protein
MMADCNDGSSVTKCKDGNDGRSLFVRKAMMVQ